MWPEAEHRNPIVAAFTSWNQYTEARELNSLISGDTDVWIQAQAPYSKSAQTISLYLVHVCTGFGTGQSQPNNMMQNQYP